MCMSHDAFALFEKQMHRKQKKNTTQVTRLLRSFFLVKKINVGSVKKISSYFQMVILTQLMIYCP